MKNETKSLFAIGLICMAGCLFIGIFNAMQASLLHAKVIPASEYHQALGSPESGETGSQSSSSDSSNPQADKPSDDAGTQSTININTATAEELANFLPGIGLVKAQRIVEYRETVGGFESVDELINVKGIGEKTLENLRPYCRVKD